MQVTNGNRTYRLDPIYQAGHIQATDLSTGATFWLPLSIAFSYSRIPHAQISSLRTKQAASRD